MKNIVEKSVRVVAGSRLYSGAIVTSKKTPGKFWKIETIQQLPKNLKIAHCKEVSENGEEINPENVKTFNINEIFRVDLFVKQMLLFGY